MQAVIMAGGKGTRLKSITNDEIPKPMVRVAGKPILEWQVETLKENGIDSIIMVTGHLGEKITEYFRDGERFGIPITYYQEEYPLGTAGALGLIKDMLDDTFVLAFGDVIFDIDVQRMVEFHKQHSSAITLFSHPNSHPFDSDLIICDENSCVDGFISKNMERTEYYKNLVNAGFYIVNKKLCDDIETGVKTDLEKQLITGRIQSSHDVYSYRSTEYIKDAGTPERIKAVEADIGNGTVKSKNLRNKQKCIFLDRDGTINRYKGLLYKIEDFELEDQVAEAIKKINSSKWLVMVVTNQPVVARGLCEIADVEQIHNKMESLLGDSGAYLDDIAFCPHHPDKGYPGENSVYKVKCDCRKPSIGMITGLVRKYNIDIHNSWIIGDSTIDVQTGENAGMHTALVKTGVAGTDGKYDVAAEVEGESLLEIISKYVLFKENEGEYV